MEERADNRSSSSILDSFYSEYIMRAEELQEAIRRQDWTEIRRFIAWREEKLALLTTLPVSSEADRSIHKEYLNKIMILELEQINTLNELMQSLKSSIRESQEQVHTLRYSEHA
jgi:hypothetical protein